MNECECKLRRNIMKALMKAQEDFDSIEANNINPQFKNKYAKLVDLYNSCKKSLRKQGIVISHKCDTHPVTNQQTSNTILTHIETGETLEDIRFMLPEKPGSQGHGAAETYMKKYALKSLLATDVGEDDDDGESERIYLKKLDDFMKLIKKHARDPKRLYEDMLKHFRIDHHYKIGDSRLFEAACWVLDNLE